MTRAPVPISVSGPALAGSRLGVRAQKTLPCRLGDKSHERGTQQKWPEEDRRQERRRAASLYGLGTPRGGAPSKGAAERRQEHHALPFCVRGEELRHLVVEEGESGGAETKRVGGEVEAAADDSPLQLSGPIAAIAEAGEDRLEIGQAVDVRPGGGRKLLEEAESARDRPKLAFLEGSSARSGRRR